MKISIVGTGYVGLVAGACLAELGNAVLCLDPDKERVDMLIRGEIPIHEPGLPPIVRRNVTAGRLRFTRNEAESVLHGSVQFITVGTPGNSNGTINVAQVLQAGRHIGRHMTSHRLVVIKSTVPVGTAEIMHRTIRAELASRGVDAPFSIAANPEFLREGRAVEDFIRPDRIIVGTNDPRALRTLRRIYAPMLQRQRCDDPFFVMDTASAELTKYAANAMLAVRVSFMNEIANLAERVGADIEQIRRGVGSDPRIGPRFLRAGCGYGGSCLPKDIGGLLQMAHDHGLELQLLAATRRVNEAQKRRMEERIVEQLGADLRGIRLALWGLAFKPDTDDMREAPSITLIDALIARGAAIVAYDPAAMPGARRLYDNEPRLAFADTAMAALDGADALVVVTEWKEFREPDFDEVRKRLRRPLVFDGRNLYDPGAIARFGLHCFGIGRGETPHPRLPDQQPVGKRGTVRISKRGPRKPSMPDSRQIPLVRPQE